jgi:hypothetical protein
MSTQTAKCALNAQHIVDSAIAEYMDSIYLFFEETKMTWAEIHNFKYTSLVVPVPVLNAVETTGSTYSLWEDPDGAIVAQEYARIMVPSYNALKEYFEEQNSQYYFLEHESCFVVFSADPIEHEVVFKLRTNLIGIPVDDNHLLYESTYLD